MDCIHHHKVEDGNQHGRKHPIIVPGKSFINICIGIFITACDAKWTRKGRRVNGNNKCGHGYNGGQKGDDYPKVLLVKFHVD